MASKSQDRPGKPEPEPCTPQISGRRLLRVTNKCHRAPPLRRHIASGRVGRSWGGPGNRRRCGTFVRLALLLHGELVICCADSQSAMVILPAQSRPIWPCAPLVTIFCEPVPQAFPPRYARLRVLSPASPPKMNSLVAWGIPCTLCSTSVSGSAGGRTGCACARL